jgi:cytochrome c2
MRPRTTAGLVAVLVAGCGGGESDGGNERPDGATVAKDNGCLVCHRIGSEGEAELGGDLNGVGSTLTASEIRAALADPPAGMPAYNAMPKDELDALVAYLSGLRGSGR